MVCTLVVSPDLKDIINIHPTVLSPLPHMLAVYVVAIYICQVGYCVLLVFARKPETKVRFAPQFTQY